MKFGTLPPVSWPESAKKNHARYNILLMALIVVGLLLSFVAYSRSDVSPNPQQSVISIPSYVVVKSKPVKFWGELCKLENLGDLTGYTISPDIIERVQALHMVGDRIMARRGEEAGRLVVTYFNPMKELRLVWEPDNGNYISIKRFVLSRHPSGTSVQYLDRYSGMVSIESTAEVSRTVMTRLQDFVSKLS